LDGLAHERRLPARILSRVQLRPGISAGFSSGLLDSFLYVSGVVAELQAPITSRNGGGFTPYCFKDRFHLSGGNHEGRHCQVI